MDKVTLSTAEAKPDKLFYVVATIVIVDRRSKTGLLLRRSQTEKVLGGKWAYPGGKLEHGDVARALAETGGPAIAGVDNILGLLAVREAKEECGLDIDVSSTRIMKNKVFVRPDNVPVFLTILTADYTSGQVLLEPGAFTDFAWVGLAEIGKYDCVAGAEQELRLALEA